MEQKDIRIFVENARAISRPVSIGEDIYEGAKRHNIEIVPNDLPNLFTLQPKPADAFVRLVMLAVHQLERDLIIERLCHGLAATKRKTQRMTQTGHAKVNGCKSWLEKKNPSKATSLGCNQETGTRALELEGCAARLLEHCEATYSWTAHCAQASSSAPPEVPPCHGSWCSVMRFSVASYLNNARRSDPEPRTTLACFSAC